MDKPSNGEPPTPFGSVGPPWWSDKTVFLVGGGPSLCGFDFSRLAGVGHAVGVNQAMLDIPFCVAGVTLDNIFSKQRHAEMCGFAQYTQLYLALGDIWWRSTTVIPGAVYLRDRNSPVPWANPGLSAKADEIQRGATSGYVALGLAVLKRAKRIVLLGYDYRVEGSRHHYHNEYPWHTLANDKSLHVWATQFDSAAADCARLGVEVVNASPDSALTAFPKMTINEALQWGQA